MTGFQSQNLFKLPHERKYRTKMLAEPAVASTVKDDEKRTRPLHNVAIELLSDSESDVSECVIKSEEEIIREYKEHIALSKKD